MWFNSAAMGFKRRARPRFTGTLQIAIMDLLVGDKGGSAGATRAQLLQGLRSRPGVPVSGRKLSDALARLIADGWVQQAGQRASARFSAAPR